MKIMLSRIAEEILFVVEDENMYLMGIKKEIMKIYEHALVYLVAKRLSSNSNEIFGQEMINCEMEKTCEKKKNSRLDLYINSINKRSSESEINIAIEFKMGSEHSKWKKDINKLLEIKDANNLRRMFCLLTADKAIIDKSENFSNEEHLHNIMKFKFHTYGDKEALLKIWEVK
jgi:exonuclease VII large subunit